MCYKKVRYGQKDTKPKQKLYNTEFSAFLLCTHRRYGTVYKFIYLISLIFSKTFWV
jgi:hypothetical protein